MASGKISPRQKMINLMYLVFIAMLAMNMDKEVLSAFGLLTEELKLSNTSTSAKNDTAYEGLNTLAQEQTAKYLPLKEKADKIKSLSSEFYSYLDDLKSKMTAQTAVPFSPGIRFILIALLDKSKRIESFFHRKQSCIDGSIWLY